MGRDRGCSVIHLDESDLAPPHLRQTPFFNSIVWKEFR